MFDSIVCDVEFLDVAVKLYVAYVIAKNMYSPVHSRDTITCSWIIFWIIYGVLLLYVRMRSIFILSPGSGNSVKLLWVEAAGAL